MIDRWLTSKLRNLQRVKSLGVEVRERRDRIMGERSLYFYDYDNHLFEIHTGTLAQRLAIYLQTN